MFFDWDDRKAAHNLHKHAVSFEEASTVFDDDWALTFDDPDHSSDELRFITLGESQQRRILFVAHTEREDVTRIISARIATRQERKAYENER